MTSKEALRELNLTINALSTFLQRNSKKEYECIKIIEQDLDRLEQIEDNHEIATNQLEKLKNAIGVLNRYVSLTKLRNPKTNKWEDHCMYSFGLSKKITQQEYELLEEVLDYDK